MRRGQVAGVWVLAVSAADLLSRLIPEGSSAALAALVPAAVSLANEGSLGLSTPASVLNWLLLGSFVYIVTPRLFMPEYRHVTDTVPFRLLTGIFAVGTGIHALSIGVEFGPGGPSVKTGVLLTLTMALAYPLLPYVSRGWSFLSRLVAGSAVLAAGAFAQERFDRARTASADPLEFDTVSDNDEQSSSTDNPDSVQLPAGWLAVRGPILGWGLGLVVVVGAFLSPLTELVTFVLTLLVLGSDRAAERLRNRDPLEPIVRLAVLTWGYPRHLLQFGFTLALLTVATVSTILVRDRIRIVDGDILAVADGVSSPLTPDVLFEVVIVLVVITSILIYCYRIALRAPATVGYEATPPVARLPGLLAPAGALLAIGQATPPGEIFTTNIYVAGALAIALICATVLYRPTEPTSASGDWRATGYATAVLVAAVTLPGTASGERFLWDLLNGTFTPPTVGTLVSSVGVPVGAVLFLTHLPDLYGWAERRDTAVGDFIELAFIAAGSLFVLVGLGIVFVELSISPGWLLGLVLVWFVLADVSALRE